jgi:hypothetical protein
VSAKECTDVLNKLRDKIPVTEISNSKEVSCAAEKPQLRFFSEFKMHFLSTISIMFLIVLQIDDFV